MRRHQTSAAMIIVLTLPLVGGSTGCAGAPSDDRVVAVPAGHPTAASKESKAATTAPWEPTVVMNPLADAASKARVTHSADLASMPLVSPFTPRVSEAKARKIAKSRVGAFGPLMQPGKPQAVLRLALLGNPHQPASLVRKPAWFLVWRGSKAEIYGSIDFPQAERDRVFATARCVFVEPIDATNGRILSETQSCG